MAFHPVEPSQLSALLNIDSNVTVFFMFFKAITVHAAATDISQYRLRFWFSLLYADHVPFELLDSAALL
jgi:hypothetical protein